MFIQGVQCLESSRKYNIWIHMPVSCEKVVTYLCLAAYTHEINNLSGTTLLIIYYTVQSLQGDCLKMCQDHQDLLMIPRMSVLKTYTKVTYILSELPDLSGKYFHPQVSI